ncbi:hypothetical protein JD844_024708 [Phrynosoma platyrhinos]|uniref:Synaptotagmin-like protein 3 n=1 Tax=Phrynosoma platyrhinos TaxID=52577 RepID=A0ABQ7SYS1_PHRPL|nr:hypothetical protein JD844_024708 [Phrynosoma platyrhinos]
MELCEKKKQEKKMSWELDLNLLKGLEREIILEVLHRDQMLRMVDEERIRNLKIQLQKLRWKGAKSTSNENQEKSCARCQRSLGMLINRGAVCNGCSHQVCSGCRIYLNPSLWMCTVCYAYELVEVAEQSAVEKEERKGSSTSLEMRREGIGKEPWDVKVKTGEWFFEERAKKFPTEGRRETVGAKLLKSYQLLSNISVVPPTPPPFAESTTGVNTVELDQKMSKSQNDMSAEKGFLTANYGQQMDPLKERRSMSDTAIDIASKLKDSQSLQRLLSGEQDNNETAFENTSSEEFIPSSSTNDTVSSAGIRSGSLYSISSTCTEAGNFDIADVSGEIEFAIKYIFRTGTLEVCIGACKNLAYGEEKKKKCNPYVKTCLLPDKSPQSKRKTSIKKNTVDPLFQETLKPEKSGDHVAQYSGELLVRAKLALPSLSDRFQYEEQLKENTEGWRKEKAHPDYQLHVIILGANNLPMIRPDGLLNSFVKGCLCIQGGKDSRQRTPVLKKQAHPQWNHLFVFSGVTTSQLHQSSLDLTVWDHVTFGLRDQFLGGARLGKYIPTSNVGATSQACLQWEKMLNSPNTWTDITLTLYPNAPVFKF